MIMNKKISIEKDRKRNQEDENGGSYYIITNTKGESFKASYCARSRSLMYIDISFTEAQRNRIKDVVSGYECLKEGKTHINCDYSHGWISNNG